MPVPIDPCGMEMDRLRSCYSTFMRFTTGGPAVKVRWYWCPPNALPFPGRHRFASLNWEKRNEVPLVDSGQVGEVPGAPRGYSKGLTPEGITGQGHCGQLDWFRDGAPAGAPALERRADGVATCCVPFAGGVNVGGRLLYAHGSNIDQVAFIYWPDGGSEGFIVYRDGTSGLAAGGEGV